MSNNTTESQLDRLKRMTVVVADTGEIEKIKEHRPEDATTNPSLIFNAAGLKEYSALIDDGIAWAGDRSGNQVELALDKIAVNFGREILRCVPGYVSTEVDARLSFDARATTEKAEKIIKLYEAEGVAKERILIKIAATWEGIQAAKTLQAKGISCNMTLIFNLAQAAACAEAGATLISPFVGRILDWHRKNTGQTYSAADDPGVVSVKNIYRYYKRFGHSTIVMGASFRNKGEILELAGCDRLTIGPTLLRELENTPDDGFERKLSPETLEETAPEKIPANESTFRWLMNQDPMATEKLAEGIRNFAADTIKLEQIIRSRL